MMKFSKRRKFVNHKKRIMYFSLFFIILFISVGYAYLNSTLSIMGHTELSANTWNIHFENLSVTDGSVSATTPAQISGNTTSISYSVLLERPGDFYEFSVNVVNSGTLPGKISLVDINGISSSAEPYLDYSIKYTNGNLVQVDDLLNAGATKRVVVRVAYKDDLSSLPSENIELDLIYNITYVQSYEEELTTNKLVQQLKTENSSCFTKYTGQVTDQVGVTKQAENVYFNKCTEKRNIIFNNMCWQMIRTTETGGIKMIYNGDVVDGKCESSRGDHKGIVGADGSSQTLNSSYLYGDSFTYDTTNSTFTLTNPETAIWSDSTYADLIGKFTCKNTTGSCTTIYNVNGYKDNSTAYTSSYTIGDTNYAQIGTSAFNANYRIPAMVGYMFNKVYNYKTKTISTSTKFGSTFTYENGTYTLSGTTQDLTTLSGFDISNTHYTCWNDTGTCSNISYVYYISSSTVYYIDISGGKDITDAINEMLYESSVNRYNSSIKGIIDAWYSQNLSSKTIMLEDTVYCNARNIRNYGGWNPDGGSTSTYMNFKNYSKNNDLSCVNETDQFAVSNNKAKLTYPVSLATHEELYTLTNNNNSSYYSVLTKTGAWWWVLSPGYFGVSISVVRDVGAGGDLNDVGVVNSYGSRPAVSLNSGAVIASGTGSESNPWVIQE